MIDIKFLREHPEEVKENIRKKFQDSKLPLVDEVIELDAERRAIQQQADALKADRNKLSKQIGALMGQGKKDEAQEVKNQVAANAEKLAELDKRQAELEEKVTKIMMVIPNIIDPSVPIGKDDSENVEVKRYGEPVVPDFEIPYHTEIMEKLHGLDLDSARRVAGNGFYYLMGDIARLLSFESFEKQPLTIKFDKAVRQNNVILERRIKEYLSVRCGFNEIFTYPWVDIKYINAYLFNI